MKFNHHHFLTILRYQYWLHHDAGFCGPEIEEAGGMYDRILKGFDYPENAIETEASVFKHPVSQRIVREALKAGRGPK